MVSKLREALKDKVVYVSSDKSEYVLFKKFIGSSSLDISHVSDIEGLLSVMEAFDQTKNPLTLVFSDRLPEDLSAAMVDIASILGSVDVSLLSTVEFGNSYISSSVRFDVTDKEMFLKGSEKVVEDTVTDTREIDVRYWETFSRGDESEEMARLKSDMDVLIAEKTEVENQLIKMSEDMKFRGSKSNDELIRVKDLYEQRESDLRNEIQSLNDDLSKYKLMYAERYNEHEEALLKLESLRVELDSKTSLIENDLSSRESELTDMVSKLNDELLEKNVEIKNKIGTIKLMESELLEIRDKLSGCELDVTAQRELFLEERSKVEKLENTVEELEEKIADLTEQLSDLLDSYATPSDVLKLQEEIKNRDIRIQDFMEQMKKLRVETRKADETRALTLDELEKLKVSYKEMLNSSNKSMVYDEYVLNDRVNAYLYYFKVYNQPLYFKSFMTNFTSLLRENRKVLTVILREEDELMDAYYGDVRRVNTLDDVAEGEEVVLLRPSRIMFSEDDAFYNRYDAIVVIDHLRSRTRYIKSTDGMNINVFINGNEAELLDVRGLTLSSGENSIVPMQYDRDIELAVTSSIRSKYVRSKVKKWMKSAGILN